MKFLECAQFDSINQFLDHLDLGKSTINGSLEAYICKHSGTDRKISFSLEHEILSWMGQSSDCEASSPASSLSTKSSRKTLIYLILTLNHMYPDYDFSAVQAHLFFRDEEWNSFKQMFEIYMFEAAEEWALSNGDVSLLESICKAIDDVVKLDDCDIYSYNPDIHGDPFSEEGSIWSSHFFFYNKKLKRVVSIRLCCLSNSAMGGFLSDQSDADEVIFTDMDM
ncbi:Repressor of RNA polymerase III transcription MAF1-like protein [Zostera marina]|uniref:Repressor of RNA polymerase III transcription n=1 Tax=Zostera marina TaxID=29655 RepID=A0A0K9P953_ZOSMR|nr:Repressor of RNA polymerase III transcription MAF1-like protein [Zostera marina]